MKKIIFSVIIGLGLLLFYIPVSGQTMDLYYTDYGPTPQAGEYYYIVIDVVEVHNGVITNHFTPYNPTQNYPVSTIPNPWGVDVSCSDGPTQDVEEKIFRVDFTMYRDTYPPYEPPIARGTGSSDLLNSDGFYAGFNAMVDLY